MIRRLAALLPLFAVLYAHAQDPPVPPVEGGPPPPVQQPPAPVTIAQQPPRYPGGDAGLAKALRANLKYPKDALEAGLQGTVYVQYVVAVDGAVQDVKVKRGVHPLLDKAAVKAVQALPPYEQPARNNGEPVPFQAVLPVRFVPE